jgi:amphiphysin
MNDSLQSLQEYQAADEQLRRILPPVLDGLSTLLPHLLAIQIMIQYQLVGQMYTQLHEYCQTHRLPSPAPSLEQVVSTFETEFTPFREDLERNIRTISTGKAIHQPMSLPDKQQGTVTGLGLRNTARGTFARRTSSQGSLPKPSMPGQLRIGSSAVDDEEEAPVKPPRPGRISSSTRLHSHYENTATLNSHYEDEEAPPVKPPRPGAAPNVDMGSKPRISSSSKPAAMVTPDGYANSGAARPMYSASSTPSSTSTPFLTPSSTSQQVDYFSRERKASTSSGTISVAGKKKPPPPPPKKRTLSSQGEFVTAVYEFAGQGSGDLAFREGDRIKVVKKTASTDDWWEGELNGMVGSFPANYVKLE